MLNTVQKKYLRKLAHERKAVILIGQSGLTDAVVEETNNALLHHELIKIKIRAGDRQSRDDIGRELCKRLQFELVQSVGNVLTVFRKNVDKPVIKLP